MKIKDHIAIGLLILVIGGIAFTPAGWAVRKAEAIFRRLLRSKAEGELPAKAPQEIVGEADEHTAAARWMTIEKKHDKKRFVKEPVRGEKRKKRSGRTPGDRGKQDMPILPAGSEQSFDMDRQEKTVRQKQFREVRLFDSMENIGLWTVNTEERTVSRIAPFPGISGKGIAVYFDLSDGGWTSISRYTEMDISGYAGLRFSYLGTGNSNTLEIIFTDTDGNRSGTTMKTRTVSGSGWEMKIIPLKGLINFHAGGQSIDPKRIISIGFRIKKDADDPGGRGRIVFDDLELVK